MIQHTNGTRTRVGVVVQTHWDREWYFGREAFVARLQRVSAHVVEQLEAGRLQQFLFDGQVAALEDLLSHAEPELCERVLALVRAGRIVLGPWYVMADEFLCSGESLWRNLEIGMADARRHGHTQTVGYLPDTFGHIAQMPQLLDHFGIQSAVLWRGVDSPHSEFDWVAPDGTRVGTLFLSQGYYQHPFNVSDWRAALERYLEQIQAHALSPNLLLTQGGDHLLPTAELGQRLAEFNASQSHYELVEESLQAHVERVLDATAGLRLPIVGELRNNAQAFVLPDVLSTRRYLKLAHQTLEDRLLGEIEPLLAQLRIAQPKRGLDQCWRTLIQQQAHDSICGCSADSVHREMVSRFEQLGQRLDAMRHAALASAGLQGELMGQGPSPAADDANVTLFNTSPKPRTGWQQVELFLAGEAASDLQLRDDAGQALTSVLLEVTPSQHFHSPLDDFPDRIAGHSYRLAVLASLGGLEARAVQVNRLQTAPAAELPASDIANTHYRIALDAQGHLWIEAAGRRQALELSSELDAGDSYNFSPAAQPERRRHARFSLVSAHRKGAVQEMDLLIEARLPARLSDERSGPSVEEVLCTGRLRLRLSGESRFVEAELAWKNLAQDQRTRLVLPLAQPVTETWSDGGFAWTCRPVQLAHYPAEPSRREMPVAVMPSHSALQAGSVQIAHRAMNEFEIVSRDDGQALAITLVRSVGWMSRRDLVTRGVGAGPDMATPEAQCLGTSRHELRIGLLGSDALELLAEAAALRQPPLVLRGRGTCWQDAEGVRNQALQISACRRVGDALELRVWNPTDQVQSLLPSSPGWQAWAPGKTLDPHNLDVAPQGIATFRKQR